MSVKHTNFILVASCIFIRLPKFDNHIFNRRFIAHSKSKIMKKISLMIRFLTLIALFLLVYGCNSSNSSSTTKPDCSSSEAEEYMVKSFENKGYTIESVSLEQDDQNCGFAFKVVITGWGCKNIKIQKSSGEYKFKDIQDYQ